MSPLSPRSVFNEAVAALRYVVYKVVTDDSFLNMDLKMLFRWFWMEDYSRGAVMCLVGLLLIIVVQKSDISKRSKFRCSASPSLVIILIAVFIVFIEPTPSWWGEVDLAKPMGDHLDPVERTEGDAL